MTTSWKAREKCKLKQLRKLSSIRLTVKVEE